MKRDETVDVQALIDGSPIGAYRIGVFVLCAFIAMVDGFDTQSIAFAAPAIAATWQVSPSQFGAAFGAALFGAMMGGIVLGPLGDRIGRRQILGIAMVIFGLASYGCAHSQTIQGLMLWRSVTGLGLGGAIPCLIAITSEFAPLRLRATVVTTMFCGFPIGALFGGLISAKLLETFDWTAIFALGAVLPLALLPFVLLFLPESLSTALARDPRDAGARNVLSKISGRTFPASTKLTVSADRSPKKVSPVELFSRKLWLGSTLIGVLFFATLLLSYFLVNWTPLLLRQSGMSVQLAIYGNVLMNAGGIVGGLLISRLTDRLGIIRIFADRLCCGCPDGSSRRIDYLRFGNTYRGVSRWAIVHRVSVDGCRRNYPALSARALRHRRRMDNGCRPHGLVPRSPRSGLSGDGGTQHWTAILDRSRARADRRLLGVGSWAGSQPARSLRAQLDRSKRTRKNRLAARVSATS
jgi:MFS transporter, AAHS family, 4-hydroxybenzoate transporter